MSILDISSIRVCPYCGKTISKHEVLKHYLFHLVEKLRR